MIRAALGNIRSATKIQEKGLFSGFNFRAAVEYHCKFNDLLNNIRKRPLCGGDIEHPRQSWTPARALLSRLRTRVMWRTSAAVVTLLMICSALSRPSGLTTASTSWTSSARSLSRSSCSGVGAAWSTPGASWSQPRPSPHRGPCPPPCAREGGLTNARDSPDQVHHPAGDICRGALGLAGFGPLQRASSIGLRSMPLSDIFGTITARALRPTFRTDYSFHTQSATSTISAPLTPAASANCRRRI